MDSAFEEKAQKEMTAGDSRLNSWSLFTSKQQKSEEACAHYEKGAALYKTGGLCETACSNNSRAASLHYVPKYSFAYLPVSGVVESFLGAVSD
jgi:hypothetical protein